MREAARLGFRRVLVPQNLDGGVTDDVGGAELCGVEDVAAAVRWLRATAPREGLSGSVRGSEYNS